MSYPVTEQNLEYTFQALDKAVKNGAIELLVLHHKSCLDGWGSLAALKFMLSQYIDLYHVNLTVIECPYDYDYVLQELSYEINVNKIEPDIVFSLDWSPDDSILDYCRNMLRCPVMIIDHHDDKRTQMYDTYMLCPDVGIYFNNEHSGAVLTYQFFNEWRKIESEVPMILKHIEDRDLWKFNIPMTRELCTYLYFEDKKSVDVIVGILNNSTLLAPLYDKGDIITRYRDSISTNFARNHSIHTWKNQTTEVRFAYVECDSRFVSDVAEMIAINTGVDFVVCQHHDLPKAEYRIGLRSKSEKFPVNELAMKFPGGGGHVKAAGFGIKEPVDLRVIGHLMADIVSQHK